MQYSVLVASFSHKTDDQIAVRNQHMYVPTIEQKRDHLTVKLFKNIIKANNIQISKYQKTKARRKIELHH